MCWSDYGGVRETENKQSVYSCLPGTSVYEIIGRIYDSVTDHKYFSVCHSQHLWEGSCGIHSNFKLGPKQRLHEQ